ncbi:MAG: class I SAM-dependent methyltransferase [Phycisphaerales bacterium]|nr:class I SAM-dependent methyltransferase [Phycisphaerales bacterium]
MMADEWWQSFFSGLSVQFWLAVVGEEQTRIEVDFLEKSLQLTPQCDVLDVPCGGGRHSHELAARGMRVTGVDLSEEFLAAARSRAAERALQIDWQQREMRDLPWQEEFDAALCLGNSFGYLTDDGNADFLIKVAQTLKPKGRLVIDTGTLAESILPTLEPRNWYAAGDIIMLIENHYDHTAGRLNTDYTFIRDGTTEKRSSSHRVYTYRELSQLLREAGFAHFEAFGDADQKPFQLGSPRLLLVAEKRTE